MMKSFALTLLAAMAADAKVHLPWAENPFSPARRLDGHDAIMEAGMKCMPECSMLMSMMGDGATKESVCEGYDCIVKNKDSECGDLHKLLTDPPEGGMIPKGMFSCICDAGCDLTGMMGGRRRLDAHTGGGGEDPGLDEICPIANCMMPAEECQPMIEMMKKQEAESDGPGLVDIAECACKDSNLPALKGLEDVMENAKDHPDCGEYTDGGKLEGADFVCKVSTDGPDKACAKTMIAAKKVLDGDAQCKALSEMIYKEAGGEKGKSCIADMEAAQPAADDTAASAGFRALPGLGLLLLGLMSLVR